MNNIPKLRELLEAAQDAMNDGLPAHNQHNLCIAELLAVVEATQVMHEARTTDEEEHGYEVIEQALAALEAKLKEQV